MDKITQNLMQSFARDYELPQNDEFALFETYVNYCIAMKENGNIELKTHELHELSTGKANPGIDGVIIIVNGKMINCIPDIEDLIKINNRIEVKFVLIQSKISTNFDNNGMLNFFHFSELFFTEKMGEGNTEEMQKFVEIKNYIFDNSSKLKENPSLILYYVTTGKWTGSTTLEALCTKTKKKFNEMNLFSKIEIMPIGASEIQDMYRKSTSHIEATFIFAKRATMYSKDNGESGYSGVIPFSEYKKIIMNDDKSLRAIFEDNIRDFIGETNDVNKSIQETIESNDPTQFCMMNNGITIVASDLKPLGDKFTIIDYQIVNGCQTSHILYNSAQINETDIGELIIPIRLIITKDESLKGNITKATNNQTAIKKEQLEALSTFQRKIEEYYRTFSGEENQLFYERRTGQYRNQSVVKAKIVPISSQIKSITAMFLDKPSEVSGQYGTIAKRVKDEIFKSDHYAIPYYCSALALYKIESFFKNGKLDKKYWKARYHTMMLFRRMIAGDNMPDLNSKKIENYCNKLIEALNNEERALYYFNSIINFMIKKEEAIDFDDRKTFERKTTTTYLLQRNDELRHYIEKLRE